MNYLLFIKGLAKERNKKRLAGVLRKLGDIEKYKNNEVLHRILKRKTNFLNQSKVKKEKIGLHKKYLLDYHGLKRKTYFVLIKHGCKKCGSHRHIHLHHIVPKSKGGTNDILNLEPLCNQCHEKVHGFKMSGFKVMGNRVAV